MASHAILQSCLSSAWGGLEMVAFETAARLTQEGHHAVTACLRDSPLHRELERAGLNALPVVRRHKYFALSAQRAIRAQLRARPFTAVLAHQMNDLWQLVPALRGLNSVRLVGIAHTFVGVSKKDWLHRQLYGRLDTLVALTSIHKENLLKHLPVVPERIAIIPNSIDTRKFHPGLRSEEFRREFGTPLIGVVSRLDRNKGLLETVRVAARLREAGLEFQLVIAGKETAGESGAKAALEAEISRLNLGRHVRLAGHRSDISTVIASLDVLLLPSPAETFGRVLIEAMACKVPVAASSGGGVPDIVKHEHNGLLFPPLDEAAMAEALTRYLRDDGLRERLARQGLEDARTIYDTTVVERRLWEILGIR